MPVALDTPPSPLPPSIDSTPAGGAQAPAGDPGAMNFLALMANMNALAAAVLPRTPAAATPAAEAAASEVLGALQGATQDTDEDDDATVQDEELLAALALAGVPLPVLKPAVPEITTAQGAGVGGGDALPKSVADHLGALESAYVDVTAQLASQPDVDAPLQIPTLAPLADPLVDDTAAVGTNTASTTQSNAAPAQLHALAAHAAASSDVATVRELRAPVGTHAWTHQLGDEIAWMMQQGQDAASLRLSPQDLGPLEVRISVRDSSASVWFGAAHAETRSALEQALPRLREMLASQGLALADAGVFKEAPRHQPRPSAFNSPDAGVDPASDVASSSRTAPVSVRLLDTYV